MLIIFCARFVVFQGYISQRWELSSKHEEHSGSSKLRSRRIAEATFPYSYGLRNFTALGKILSTFDFLSSFLFLPNFSPCNSV